MPQRICRQVAIVLVLFLLSGGRAEQRTKRAVNQTVGPADLGHATQERHGEQGHVGGGDHSGHGEVVGDVHGEQGQVGGGVHGEHGHGVHEAGAHGGIHLASWRWEEYSNHVMFTGNGLLHHRLGKFGPLSVISKKRYLFSI